MNFRSQRLKINVFFFIPLYEVRDELTLLSIMIAEPNPV